MKTPLRISSYLALAVVLITVAVRIVNAARYSLAKPGDSKNCNFEGTWKSESAPFVEGAILAEIPSPVPSGGPFDVKAFVYYRITSLYRPGSFVTMEMEGFVDATGRTSGGNSEQPIILPPQITFKLKGGARGPQTIDYVSTADDQFTRLTGGYRSSSPYDIGTFSLQKKR